MVIEMIFDKVPKLIGDQFDQPSNGTLVLY